MGPLIPLRHVNLEKQIDILKWKKKILRKQKYDCNVMFMDLSYLQATKLSLTFYGNVKIRLVTLLLSVYLFVLMVVLTVNK